MLPLNYVLHKQWLLTCSLVSFVSCVKCFWGLIHLRACVCVCVGGGGSALCVPKVSFFLQLSCFFFVCFFSTEDHLKSTSCAIAFKTLYLWRASLFIQIWINTCKNAIQDTCTDRACKDAQTVREDFVEGQNENYTLPIYMKKTEHHNQLLPLVLLWLSVLLI